MKKLLIIATIVVHAITAPIQENGENTKLALQRPSPINPDIPSDPRPADNKVVIITDPEEIARRNLEITEKPQVVFLTHSNEDVSNESHEDRKIQLNNAQFRNTAQILPDFSNSVTKLQSHPIYRTPETITTLAALRNHSDKSESSTLAEVKRDIPVPLVSRHHESKESTKVNNSKEESQIAESNEDTPSSNSAISNSRIMPLIRPHPVPVDELFARPKPQPAN